MKDVAQAAAPVTAGLQAGARAASRGMEAAAISSADRRYASTKRSERGWPSASLLNAPPWGKRRRVGDVHRRRGRDSHEIAHGVVVLESAQTAQRRTTGVDRARIACRRQRRNVRHHHATPCRATAGRAARRPIAACRRAPRHPAARCGPRHPGSARRAQPRHRRRPSAARRGLESPSITGQRRGHQAGQPGSGAERRAPARLPGPSLSGLWTAHLGPLPPGAQLASDGALSNLSPAPRHCYETAHRTDVPPVAAGGRREPAAGSPSRAQRLPRCGSRPPRYPRRPARHASRSGR